MHFSLTTCEVLRHAAPGLAAFLRYNINHLFHEYLCSIIYSILCSKMNIVILHSVHENDISININFHRATSRNTKFDNDCDLEYLCV